MKMNIFTYLTENVLNVQHNFRQATSEIKLKIQEGKISQLKKSCSHDS